MVSSLNTKANNFRKTDFYNVLYNNFKHIFGMYDKYLKTPRPIFDMK